MIQLFDSHCHLDDVVYENNLDQIQKKCLVNGVEGLIIVGINLERSNRAVQIATTHQVWYASVGVHPHDATSCNREILAELTNLSKNEKVVAWGEVGLDFNRNYSPRDIQEKWFIEQLNIADQLELPIIFHERDTKGRFLDILEYYSNLNRKGVVHCFSGNHHEMKKYLDLNLHIGITGIVTHKDRGRHLRELVKAIPLDRILIETDAPYLTPTPERNKFKRNEPAFVKSVFLKLVSVLNEDPVVLSKIIWNNTCQVFNIKFNG